MKWIENHEFYVQISYVQASVYKLLWLVGASRLVELVENPKSISLHLCYTIFTLVIYLLQHNFIIQLENNKQQLKIIHQATLIKNNTKGCCLVIHKVD